MLQPIEKTVSLSQNTSAVYRKLSARLSGDLELLVQNNTVELSKLQSWLAAVKHKKTANGNDADISQLYALLLRDYSAHLAGQPAVVSSPTSEGRMKRLAKRMGFYCLCSVGAFFSFYNGIGGFAKMASVLSLTGGALLAVSLGFSLLSVSVFIGGDIASAIKQRGLAFWDYARHVDELLATRQAIQISLEQIRAAYVKADTVRDYLAIDERILLLETAVAALAAERVKLYSQLEKRSHSYRRFLPHVRGAFYFAIGFFIGQSTALQLIGGVSLVAAMSNPVSAVIVLGVGALFAAIYTAFYYLVQKRGFDNQLESLTGVSGAQLAILDDEREDSLFNQLAHSKASVNKALAKSRSATLVPAKGRSPLTHARRRSESDLSKLGLNFFQQPAAKSPYADDRLPSPTPPP